MSNNHKSDGNQENPRRIFGDKNRFEANLLVERIYLDTKNVTIFHFRCSNE
jgi:hypothetical protein